MAGLLFNKKTLLLICALAFFCLSAEAYESSFPFPFEFGHSSDIYLKVKNPPTKETRQQNQAAIDLLREKGISRSPQMFVKYIKKNNTEAIKLLLDAGFDPNTNINANFPIYYASRYYSRDIIYILLKAGADPNKDFASPIRYAILKKDYDTVRLLIDYGGDVNYEEPVMLETLLYTALKKKQYDIASLLIQSGAKIDRKSYLKIKKKKLESKLGIVLD